jgi:L-ascorbate metabolism protein UlaG (beta-lactamase superfamily)
MRKFLFCFLAFYPVLFLYSQNSLDITFVANDGFLITDGTNKILIDAIFSQGSGMFTTPPADVLVQERNGTEPFNSIDFLLNTHHHADHINPAYMAEHLVNDNGSLWIGPTQVYDSLTNQESFGTIEDRLIPLLPGTAVKIDTLINDFRFHIVRLIHYNNSDNILQNLGFIFTLGDINIFHPGDGFLNDTAEIENLNLATDSIDILFLSYRVLDNNFEYLGRKIIQYLNPKAMILMHIPINQAEHYRSLVAGLQHLPPIYVMEEQMGSLTFIPSGDSLIVEGNVGIISKTETRYTIFPNPADDEIIIQLDHEASSIANLEILDLSGKKMITRNFLPGEKELSLNLAQYPKGLYVLKITVNSIVHSTMFMH